MREPLPAAEGGSRRDHTTLPTDYNRRSTIIVAHKYCFVIVLSSILSSLNQGRELSAGMMHVPLGFIITGGAKGVASAEKTVDGKRDGMKNRHLNKKYFSDLYCICNQLIQNGTCDYTANRPGSSLPCGQQRKLADGKGI